MIALLGTIGTHEHRHLDGRCTVLLLEHIRGGRPGRRGL
jgi:hypothetical protein